MNTRTSGTLSREDMQRMSISRSHECDTHEVEFPQDDMEPGGFADIGAASGELNLEGDSSMQVTSFQKPFVSIGFSTTKNITNIKA